MAGKAKTKAAKGGKQAAGRAAKAAPSKAAPTKNVRQTGRIPAAAKAAAKPPIKSDPASKKTAVSAAKPIAKPAPSKPAQAAKTLAKKGPPTAFRDLVRRLAATNLRHRLLPRGARILVAASGGSDSTALVLALRELSQRPEFGWKIELAHAVHGDSAHDHQAEAFLAGQAKRWGLPLHLGTANSKPQPGADQRSVQALARSARYTFLAATARDAGCTFIATAHQRDDQAETVLLRAATGRWLSGLSGIPVKRWADRKTPQVLVVRPLIDAPKTAILSALRALGEAWLEDPENHTGDYLRGIVRNNVMPAFQKVNPEAASHIAELAEQAAEFDNYLRAEVADLMPQIRQAWRGRLAMLSADQLADLPPMVARILVRETLLALGTPAQALSMERVRRIVELAASARGPQAVARKMELGAGIVAVAGRGGVQLSRGIEAGVMRKAAPRPSGPKMAATSTARPALLDERVRPGLASGAAARKPGMPAMLVAPTVGAFEVAFAQHGCGAQVATGAGPLFASVSATNVEKKDIPGLEKLRDGGGSRLVELIDASKLSGALVVRNGRRGDVFQPLGASRPKRLSVYLIDRHVPRGLRSSIPLVCDAKGIVWVVGHSIDERVKLSPATALAMKLQAAPEKK